MIDDKSRPDLLPVRLPGVTEEHLIDTEEDWFSSPNFRTSIGPMLRPATWRWVLCYASSTVQTHRAHGSSAAGIPAYCFRLFPSVSSPPRIWPRAIEPTE